MVEGFVAPGFERVRATFERSFEELGEVGAAAAVQLHGEPVVDLWGGLADPTSNRPWAADTLAVVLSTTKGATAVCANLLVERGQIDLDDPVSTYWPEFAANGKAGISVRWLLEHKAGLYTVDEPPSLAEALCWDPIVERLAKQAPYWEPGTRHGYHAMTFGWLVGEVVRRVTGQSIGTYLREQVAEPLGLDLHLGAPPEVQARLARLLFDDPNPWGPLPADSPIRRASVLEDLTWDGYNTAAVRAAELPATNMVTDARSLARLYASLVGDVDGVRTLSPETVAAAMTSTSTGYDAVLFMKTEFGLGFSLESGVGGLGGPGTFGHHGAGGSVGFADPARGIGFGYVMNQMQQHPSGDLRSEALVESLHACLDG